MAKLIQYGAFFIMIVLMCLCIEARAQKNYKLVVIPVDNAGAVNALKLKTDFPTIPACLQYVRQLPGMLMAEGYISASIDSLHQDSSSVQMQLFLGEKYIWNDVRVDEKDWYLLNQLGFNKATFHNKPFDGAKVSQLYNLLLDYFANNGYPFAKAGLDSVALNGGSINAHLNIDKGFLYHIDTINIASSIRLSRNFIYRYLEIKPHDIYQQSKLDKINQRITELPYVEQLEPWSITMLNTGSDVNLYLQPRKSNQLNVLVGFLPANADLGGKLLLTGDATLDLRNPFGNGETIAVNWQQLQPSAPRLDLLFQRPYIFNSPFGFNFKFDLYKKDSSYININSQFGVQYILSAKQSGSVFIQLQSTKVLNIDTGAVILTKQLPSIIDGSSVSLALQYDFNNTNYRFNPRSGNELELITSFGNKKIKENSSILAIKDTTFNYAQLYDSIKQNSYQFRVRITAAHYFPLGKQSTFKTAINAGWYQSANYFDNDLFQIGGNKLLRGFDEESIYTNQFAIGTAEYHYLLGQNSYLFVFTDAGWAKYQSLSMDYSHTYLGLGIGLAFETKTGVFNISFAEGARNDLGFDFRQLKIHLGFVSVF